ncbi:type I secretion system permease/ATPase [Pararhodobacter zhoushanensis]|uniref:ATP-binding cassette domain-containing protein n=1 Tax=Pararhodobacter zhoushanensis TaxID=2479545 RepID=A0ABT3GVI6_9RHOB|nr:ATP-binding cassette domain-containing protein [Pararhodobacter zhoushanensis]MCW1931540.1 ATP-binding cassette domain-containing protein [Pararhodobacter zhoushanensis]
MPNRITAGNWTAELRGLWLAVLVFGAVSNLLILTGPIFMLQVYDRVLTGRSTATLIVLFALVAFVYAMMAGIDTARAQVMVRIGARTRHALEQRVFEASLRARLRDPPDPRAAMAMQDLDTVQRVLGSTVAQAAFDLPWTLVFLAILYAVHPALGWLAVGGSVVLAVQAFAGHLAQRRLLGDARHEGAAADQLQAAIENEGSDRVAGLTPDVIARWLGHRDHALAALLRTADGSVRSSALARTFRLFLQSATLALGAWLVLQEQLSPGLMVGASILLGRALAPVEQLAAHWSTLHAALTGWRRLDAFLRATGRPVEPVLGSFDGALSVRGLVVVPQGRREAVLRLHGFEVSPGRALGVIGPGGSGKSLFARVLAGSVPPSAGVLRQGQVPLSKVPVNRIGFLPQRFGLLPGTIAETISRHAPGADPARIEAAARLAGAHPGIAALFAGYETPTAPDAAHLPGGLLQRIGLARAYYGDPALVVLDEPNAHLDADAQAAFNTAIRELKARGAVIVITALRPASISECDDLLVLDGGVQTGFGPRDIILRQMVRNHVAVVPAGREP